MTVRLFTAADQDDVRTDLGALASMVFGAVAAVVEPAGTSGDTDKTIMRLHNTAGGGGHLGLAIRGNRLRMTNGVDSSETGNVVSGNPMLALARMTLSEAAPRFSIYDYGFDDWTHLVGDTAIGASPQGPGSGGTVRFSVAGTEHFDGRVAARAAWSNSVPWSLDATGDAAVEGAGLEAGAQNWADAFPSALWLFNQPDSSDDVVDVTGNGADGTSISGTTVVIGDDPPGWEGDILDIAASGVGGGSLSATLFDPALDATGILRGDGAPLRALLLTSTGLVETP